MNLSPLPIQKFFGNNGRPLVGGKLFTYVAGTNTKITTYVDSSGSAQNTNPIILNFRGECRLWIDPTLVYKFVLSPPWDTDPPTNPIWTVDNITAAPLPFDNAAVASGSANSIELSIPWVTSPVAFTRVVFKALHTNTGATTISINGGPARPVVSQALLAMGGGEITANGIYEAIYDGGSWILQWQEKYPRTTEESAAALVPVNYNIPSHRETGGFVRPARYFNNVIPGTTDCTAILNTIANFCRTNRYSIELEPETWLFSAPLDFTGILVQGPTGKTTSISFVPHLQSSAAIIDCIVSTGNSFFRDFFIHGGWDGVTPGLGGDIFHFLGPTTYNIHFENITAMFAKRSFIRWSGAGYSSINAFRGQVAGNHGLEFDQSVAINTTVQVTGNSTFSTVRSGYGIAILGDCHNMTFDGVILEDTSGIRIAAPAINCRALVFNNVYQENFVDPSTNYLDGTGGSSIGLTITNGYAVGRVIQGISAYNDVHIYGMAGATIAPIPFAGRIIQADSGPQLIAVTGGVDFTVTSVSVPPGTWRVYATMQTLQNTASGMLGAACALTTVVGDSGLQNSTGANFKQGADEARITPNGGGMDIRLNCFMVHENNTGANQTIYLRGWANFSGAGNLSYRGVITAELLQ